MEKEKFSKDTLKMEMKHLITYVYGQCDVCLCKRKKVYKNRDNCIHYLIFQALTVATGKDLIFFGEQYPAKLEVLTRYFENLKLRPYECEEAFFKKYGLVWDKVIHDYIDLDLEKNYTSPLNQDDDTPF